MRHRAGTRKIGRSAGLCSWWRLISPYTICLSFTLSPLWPTVVLPSLESPIVSPLGLSPVARQITSPSWWWRRPFSSHEITLLKASSAAASTSKLEISSATPSSEPTSEWGRGEWSGVGEARPGRWWSIARAPSRSADVEIARRIVPRILERSRRRSLSRGRRSVAPIVVTVSERSSPIRTA